MEDMEAAGREANRDALFAGMTAALVGAVIGRHIMGFGRNRTILTGLLTGSFSGFFFSRAFLSSRIAMMEDRRHMHALEQEQKPS